MGPLLQHVVDFATNYQLLFLSGTAGAAAYRLMNSMTFTMFVKHLLVSIFVSSLVCLVIKSFTDWSGDAIFAVGAASGFFSSKLINEGNEIVEGLSDIVKEKLGKIGNNKNEEV